MDLIFSVQLIKTNICIILEITSDCAVASRRQRLKLSLELNLSSPPYEAANPFLSISLLYLSMKLNTNSLLQFYLKNS